MKLQLVTHPNPILRKRCNEFDIDEIERLINQENSWISDCFYQMSDIMFDNGGIGLAAPQCGLDKRLFIMDIDDVVCCMINPTWEPINDKKETGDEGCLSFPNLVIPVERYANIQVSYYDRFGEDFSHEMSGLHARCFQHETDHLDGNCIDKKVSSLVLSIAKRKARKRKNGI